MTQVVFLSRLYWPHVGGVERHVYFLSQELIKQGYKITVVTSQYEKNLSLQEKVDGVNIVRIPRQALSSKVGVWRWMWRQRMIFADTEIIHAHDVFWWYLPLKLLWPTKPVWTTFHGYEGNQPPTWKAVVHRKLVEILSTKTICIGEFMKKWYRARPDKILYGAADMPLTPQPTTKSVAFVGRLSKDTGIMMYLEGLSLMSSRLPLHVYGDGDLLPVARAYAKKHNLPVQFHGWMRDVNAIYARHSLLFVSRYLAILEAMQSQRLVVALYDNAIKHDYLLCHPQAKNMIIAGSGADMARQLEELTPATSRSKINKAHAWARDQTWNKLVKEYLELWNLTLPQQ